MKDSKVKNFKEKYLLLNNTNKHIVFETIKRMERPPKHESVKNALYKKIKEKRDSLGMTYTKLYNQLNQKQNGTLDKKHYDTYLRRKSLKGGLFDDMCEILKISPKEIYNIKNSFVVQSQDVNNIEWLFYTLSPRNQSAMLYLVSALYMSEHSPEVFDED